jgi:hypothetical protein
MGLFFALLIAMHVPASFKLWTMILVSAMSIGIVFMIPKQVVLCIRERGYEKRRDQATAVTKSERVLKSLQPLICVVIIYMSFCLALLVAAHMPGSLKLWTVMLIGITMIGSGSVIPMHVYLCVSELYPVTLRIT